MSCKNLFVVLSSGGGSDASYALAAATALGARIKATYLAVDPAVPSYAIPEISAELFESARGRARADAEAALHKFEAMARKQDLDVQALVVQGLMHEAAGALVRMARYSDLIIVMQPNPDADRHEHEAALEQLLFEAGRPLLLVPHLQQKTFSLDFVLVAWDESATASRAVAVAMPLLERARRIEVVTVEGAAKADRNSCHKLADCLQAHGLPAQGRWLLNTGKVSGTILSYAAETGADLVVMGGYGHSRLREFILGGVTRSMLKTMTVPIMMMH